MPEPPLLLADRVTGLDAVPGSMGKGTIWTETDVEADSWYLHRGMIPAGVMIESGQADLMLISYLGIDALNQGDRVYRLLGCQLTYEGGQPRPGETMCYDIHVDGHAQQDKVRLFFFHYDCRVDDEIRLSVRHGQAGFFTDEELANSAGVLWSPEEAEIEANPRLDPPIAASLASSFERADLEALAEGRPWDCFGSGFEEAHCHTDTPRLAGGRMLFLDKVSELDHRGGPWGRGYLLAESEISSDDWYFDGHFLNDPCMPGTLMFEGCLQAMAFYMISMGFSLQADGWRFQPVQGEPFDLRCRGQATPQSRHLKYEVFVEEVHSGPIPRLYADLLVTVDGRKAFHAKRVGLELVPDWPLSSRPELLADHRETKAVASVPQSDGSTFEFGYPALLACAWGKPSAAFGEMYSAFDGPRRVPRLPGPPYHFLSRVVSLDGPIGVLKSGAVVVVEYDVPEDVWYLAENGCPTMPFCVLLEAALQPCGWLASYIGSALTSQNDLCFRNLDGTCRQYEELHAGSGTMSSHVTLTNLSQSAGMIIVSFKVECTIDGRLVYDMDTVFGFFPVEALEQQIGLPTSDELRAELTVDSSFEVDLKSRPARFFLSQPRLPSEMLTMIDKVTGYWPEGGEKGLGRLRAEKQVEPSHWYFKAHFFQDPVQPGSLGIEAMIQLLQFFMLERGLHEGIDNPRFEPLALDDPMTWKYRGQVTPSNNVVHVTLDVLEIAEDERGVLAVAKSSLWVDGKRIYEASRFGMRIVSGSLPTGDDTPRSESRVLDPVAETWLADHRPTWNRPAVPMMGIVDELASAVSGKVISLEDVQVKRLLGDVPNSVDLLKG